MITAKHPRSIIDVCNDGKAQLGCFASELLPKLTGVPSKAFFVCVVTPSRPAQLASPPAIHVVQRFVGVSNIAMPQGLLVRSF